jgi:hypothetical protein
MRSDRVMMTAILAVGALALVAFQKATDVQRFKEIAVERIDVVEPDGTLRMTISDAARSPGWVFKGKPYPGRPKGAGMIFFNDEGEEDGGIGFGGRKVDGKVTADGGMAFDQYQEDESVNIRYSDENGRRRTGLSVNDRADMPLTDVIARRDSIRALPAGPARDSAMTAFVYNNGHPLAAQRLFAGRDPNKNAVINLSDPLGHTRLRLVVDSTGSASIDFLDATGRVTKTVTP